MKLTSVLPIILLVYVFEGIYTAPPVLSGGRNCMEPHPQLTQQQQQKRQQLQEKQRRELKKNIFVSRGWSAGGMPFSVLYMDPTILSKSKQQSNIETKQLKNRQRNLVKQQQSKSQPIGQNRSKNQNNRTPHSVIPQLFVSYGWGPLGK